MYFTGDPYLETDRIYQRIAEPARPRVVVALEPPARNMEPKARGIEAGAMICQFDITF